MRQAFGCLSRGGTHVKDIGLYIRQYLHRAGVRVARARVLPKDFQEWDEIQKDFLAIKVEEHIVSLVLTPLDHHIP